MSQTSRNIGAGKYQILAFSSHIFTKEIALHFFWTDLPRGFLLMRSQIRKIRENFREKREFFGIWQNVANPDSKFLFHNHLTSKIFKKSVSEIK